MSRIGGHRVTNCSLDVPGFGRREVVVEALGYGMSIVGTTGGARRFQAYYPFIRTSGTWYIQVAFPEVSERDALHFWMVSYVARCTDPYKTPLNPITVTVPSRSFVKVGYPTASFEFGDQFGVGVYRTVIGFTSASDPSTSEIAGSRYMPPLRDSAARHFYPADLQESGLPDPTPVDFIPLGDDPWDTPGSSTIRRS